MRTTTLVVYRKPTNVPTITSIFVVYRKRTVMHVLSGKKPPINGIAYCAGL
jgi:hypothetical protein